jgi:hypothetical protein
MTSMVDLDGGGELGERRAKARELVAAVHALCERPTDAGAVKAVLAFPLERKAWEGLGDDVDEELAELTTLMPRVLFAVDREGGDARLV